MKRALYLLGAAFAMLVVSPAHAVAHPLGNFTVNRSSGFEISPTEIALHYAVDVAEVPTFQEFSKIDADRNNAASASELSSYAQSKARFILGGLLLRVDGTATQLRIVDAVASLHKGQGGLQVLRLDVQLTTALAHPSATIDYRDVNFGSLPGWREVVATGVRGEAVASSDVPFTSVSDRLRAYPTRLLQHPPAVTSARMQVAPGEQRAGVPQKDERTVATTRLFGQRFAQLIERDLTLPSIMIALALALGFGALHALGPGHGKTVMAAYLVGSDGDARHAVMVGLAVSLMHTGSVVVLGVLTLWLSSMFSPATVYPWLAFVSGVLILGFGSWLLFTRSRARMHAGEATHDDHHLPHAAPFSKQGLGAIAVSGGLVPSPTAVVVLLGAIALHRIALGIVLVAAFSVGLAVALASVGILVLRARTFAAARWGTGTTSLVPTLSSAAIVLLGAFLTVRAVLTLG